MFDIKYETCNNTKIKKKNKVQIKCFLCIIYLFIVRNLIKLYFGLIMQKA